jgi:hypothetical protein
MTGVKQISLFSFVSSFRSMRSFKRACTENRTHAKSGVLFSQRRHV